jgi:tetratricopeptide (TPR) repeat protein
MNRWIQQFIDLWRRHPRDAGVPVVPRPRRPAEVRAALDRADVLLAENRAAEAQPHLDAVGPLLQRPASDDARRELAIFRVLGAELLQQMGRGDIAMNWVAMTREALTAVQDEALRERLAARADAIEVLATSVEVANAEKLVAGERALASAAAQGSPETLLRLVWTAHWMGQIHHRRGDWSQARAALERAIELAARLTHPETPWVTHWDSKAMSVFALSAGVAAANAALELSGVARALGHDDEARTWFARALAALDRERLPGAHLARAHVLLIRALHEPLDDLQGPAVRIGYLEAAIAESIAVDGPRGWAFAHQAETALARQHAAMGSADQALRHLELALAAALRVGEPGVALVVGAHYGLGLHHVVVGDNVSARTSLSAAWELGHAHTDPEVRRLATLGGAHLHARLLETGATGEATLLLDGMEAVVPTLAEEARTPLAAMLADARGMEHVQAGRFDEARAHFERALHLVEGVPVEERVGASRGMLMHLAVALARAERLGEAEARLTEALALPPNPEAPGGDGAGRAEIHLQRAGLRMGLDRPGDAEADLRRAFESGRDSGTPVGRKTAAVASLGLGDMHRDEPDARRRHYETAIQLGRLCGLDEGLDVARAAELRLREPAE